MAEFTHLNQSGEARMVDVGEKPVTLRVAKASALVAMQPETAAAIRENRLAKGEVLQVARIAGIMAAKRTPELIPLCHGIPLEHVEVEFEFSSSTELTIRTHAQLHAKTGVEMEAMTAASVAALTIYDMAKAIDRSMEIKSVVLTYKSGGKSGTYVRDQET